MDRMTTTTVVFRCPFMLRTGEGPFPAGHYVVETVEELIPGLSFQAYRRVSTTMTVPVGFGRYAARQTLMIDPKELERALVRDAAAATGVSQ